MYYEKSWVRQYFFSNGDFNYNKLYEETFKFISNIVEYKIPYYILLFINVFLYYAFLNNKTVSEEIDATQIMTNVENMGIDTDYIDYYEYGFSKDLIEKIKSLDIVVNLENIDRIEIFDEYEKIMIKEFIELVR